MNCLLSRRLLLAAPREQTAEHRAHIASCERCARLEGRLVHLDRSIEDAALVPIPDALSHRILLPQRAPNVWQYAAAAVVVLASVVVALLAGDIVETPGYPRTVQAVGPTHPAVVAIAEVMDDRLELEAQAHDGREMEQGLKRLGLTIKAGQASAHYIGKCHIEGGTDCDHIVLSTSDAHANVMLVPDYPINNRVLVEDRRMVALVGPAGKGSYIVVAESPKVARRVEKLLVRG